MAALRQILVVDDEASIRHVLTLVLSESGFEVRAVGNGTDALAELKAHPYDAVISDVRMPGLDGVSLMKEALALNPDLTFLVMSAYGSKDLALSVVAQGAWDFVEKPFKPEEIVFLLKKADERLRLIRENRRLQGAGPAAGPLDRLTGTTEVMEQLKKNVTRVAPVATTVLISGESGTGKELVARAIHALSPRASMPFVPVNCGAIPAGLIESELFGHARGAFTDARVARRGLFSEAHGGTLFLDEIGELPMQAQVKLLRVLQEGEVRPVGESKAEKVDVRVVAATLRDLARLVERGDFREDLYFRLNVVPLRVPALRERRADVLPLALEFLARFNRTLNRDPFLTGFSPEAEQLLTSYDWPGNVRELENAIERAVLLSDGPQIVPANLPEKIWNAAPREHAATLPTPQAMEFSLKRAVATLEDQFIRAALRQTRGNRTRAAELLEISHRALLYKLKDYGIDPDAEGEKSGSS